MRDREATFEEYRALPVGRQRALILLCQVLLYPAVTWLAVAAFLSGLRDAFSRARSEWAQDLEDGRADIARMKQERRK